ncbi:conserved hypothetical protein [Desulfonatronospira thiodismutans ASO3-1]|uniref:Uncharacterized protein n=1 Tax=Desulfonatronospira thiodismutans ASO3-1 TaxID=555779 RepID=D6SPK4_9BACT|nr:MULTISPECIES: hypothetical protein [Desulfonatronospira]EFI34680.1 conserved hypothetical protein [Desulfonatronospira thiodismutans ASO3-1]RQD73151.1 MAG: hypothetical protein D5S03_13220 [Desulfonatronospira sp. MSAO_Bac3]
MQKWYDYFLEADAYDWSDQKIPVPRFRLNSLLSLKKYLDLIHIRQCLIRPFLKTDNYPLVEARELLPSFESDLYEYEDLPGFSLVALARPLEYFNEIFQFDILHSRWAKIITTHGEACPVPDTISHTNVSTFQSRLPKNIQERFKDELGGTDIAELYNYPRVLNFILNMDRGHVMSMDTRNEFYLSGVYASFPSYLDPELKRFGLQIKKFKPNDNLRYELNRNFVYQFLMELYGYPVVSERRTSAALFSRRLFKMGERFLIRALGQTDRTITTLYNTGDCKFYPALEKVALARVETKKKDVLKFLKENGYFLDEEKKAVILRVRYKQHQYDPDNIREERALSVLRQEVIHPRTGEVCSQLNIIKDTFFMTLKLNDIVKGEFSGRIKYKREIIENTDTHEKRLKFLYAWLSKHQRRIIGYSDEFYAGVTKVLDNYLLNPELFEDFQALNDLYQEVWQKYSYIRQARKIRILQDILERRYEDKKINYLQMLEHSNSVLEELKFETGNYFPDIITRAIATVEKIANDRYLLRNYVNREENSLTQYGQEVRERYFRMNFLLNELKTIRRVKREPISYN